MKTSNRGIKLIKEAEGCVLKAYTCPAGVLTIGYGHTGKDVTEGLTITEEQAEELLKKDLEKFEKTVEKYVEVEMNQNQFDALVSFTFNLGSGNLAKSTLLKKLNAKDYAGAAEQFLVWNKATVDGVKKELPGLTTRRKKERELFLDPVIESTDEVPDGALDENEDGTVNVYDSNNNKVGTITEEVAEAVTTFNATEQSQSQAQSQAQVQAKGSGANYMVKVLCSALRIRKEPSVNSKIAGVIRDKGTYTIVEEKDGWGKLKSGAGWICLEWTKKV